MMAKKLRDLSILCGAMCAALLCMSALAAAQPPLPCNPWGTATIYGEPAPNGTVVEAYINDSLVATMPGGTINGYYSIIIPGDDPETPEREGGRAGEEVLIAVAGNVILPPLTWTGGATSRLDLTVEAKTIIVNQTTQACTSGDVYYPSVQEALAVANSGDTIIVCPGIYTETISVDVPVTIRSHEGPAVTVINASGSGDNGVNLYASNVTLSGFTISGAGWSRSAIYLQQVEHCTVTNNIITANDYVGIYLALADNNFIFNNTVSWNDEYGIYVSGSNNTVHNNSINNNTDYGMVLPSNSRYNRLVDNTISSNAYGIWLFDSCNNDITTNNIDANSNYGLWLRNATINSITSNMISANTRGLYLEDASTDNNIEHNTIAGNLGYELYNDQPDPIAAERNWWGTIYCTLIDGRIYDDEEGGGAVDFDPVLDAPAPGGCVTPCARLPIVVNLTAPACSLGFAYYPTIQAAVDNASGGDSIIVCPGTYTENVYVDVPVDIESYNGPESTIVHAYNPWEHVFKLAAPGSTISGFSVTGTKPNPFAGISVEADGCTVENNVAFDGDVGIMLLSHCNRVAGNNVSGNNYGIWLANAGENTITNNSVTSSTVHGIHVEFAANNYVYLNEFRNNTNNTYSSISSTIWSSPEKLSYEYGGNVYENYLGNYWDDYTSSDADGDGIGDVPYMIDLDKDSYPLMQPRGHYVVPAQVYRFDTGAPMNPYPSIPGTHNGSLTPWHTLRVSKIFTYPCPGTGGHTESAAFYNGSGAVLGTATWKGYQGDWRTLAFDISFVLAANETYNFSIRTGSYPQIHQTHELDTANGTLRCTNFTDINGNHYTGQLPAFRLE